MKKLYATIFLAFIFLNSFAQVWSNIGSGAQNTTGDYPAVYSMLVFNDELYVAGCFTSIKGVPASYIAKFDGTNWSPVGNGFTHTGNSTIMYSGVKALAVFNGELYAGGVMDRSGSTPIYNVAKWDGNSWQPVGNLASGSSVLSLCVFNNELYAGGFIYGHHSIVKWNGSAWLSLGGGMQDSIGLPALVRDMRVFDNKLYIGGQFYTGGGVQSRNLITFDGLHFAAIGSGAIGEYGITKLGEYNNNLIITGGFTDVNGIPFNNIAQFDRTTWTTFSTGAGYPGGYSFDVQPVINYNNSMYVGGYMSNAGPVSVNGIARWDGTSWMGVGSGHNGVIGSMAVYHDELYVGGNFTIAGGIPALNIAKLKDGTLDINEADNNSSLNVYPNPFSTEATLQTKENFQNATLTVVDCYGQIVRQIKNLSGNTLIFSREELAAGIYMVQLTLESKVIAGGKIVITEK